MGVNEVQTAIGLIPEQYRIYVFGALAVILLIGLVKKLFKLVKFVIWCALAYAVLIYFGIL